MPRLLLALASGGALYAAFPGLGIWPLALLGLGALALATHDTGFWRGAGLGMVAGLTFFVPLLSWSGVYVGALPWVALSTLQALFVAVAGGLVGLVSRGRRLRPVAFALIWTAAEVARSEVPFGGFPWGRIAFSQNESPLLGWAPLVGSTGLGFLTALAGALLARAVLELRASPRVWALLPAGAVAVLVLLPVLVPRPVDGETLAVAAVQGNVPRPGLDFNAERRQVLDNHATLTTALGEEIAAGERAPVDLVLWPENSSDIDPTRNPDAAAVVDDALAAVGVPVVVGAVLREPDPNVSNASLVYVPGEGEVARYVKRHPVPFAEWIPYRDFFRLFSPYVDRVARDFVAGEGSGAVPIPLQSGGDVVVGIAICFEVVYDRLMLETVQSGAELLFVPTNNATFGYTDEAVQQLASSQVRSVEYGRSLVHVSTTGVSALITPDGTVHQPTGLFTAAVLQGDLPLRTELTPAARIGLWPAIAVCVGAAVVLVGAAAGRVRERAIRRPDHPQPGQRTEGEAT